MIDSIKEQQCTGCKMCAYICPTNAITFETDEYGFWYPKVDYDKCVSCGMCLNKCPGLHAFRSEKYQQPKVYAAWLKDTRMRLYSTSGGAYYALAKKTLEMNGIVVACRYTEDWKGAEHVLVEDESQLMPTVRSKYFQSDTAGIYKKVKEALEQNRKVLFCGTPCQCAAIQKYVGKEYDELITMDFICRGNNSPKAYKAFIEELENRYASPVKQVLFKNKRQGWKSLGILIEFENGEEYYDTRINSYWTAGFIRDNLYMRPSCHECQYRNIPRTSDFTVGDFWGIQNASEEDSFNGISVLFANSQFAVGFMDKLAEEMELEERTLDEAIKGNVCLLNSPERGIHREEFFELLDKMPFSQAVAECCGKME